MPGTAYSFVVEILKARLGPESRILEIGCGGKQYWPLLPGKYEGLDLPTSPYLEEPPEYACSAESIPCEDARFDLVFGVATFLIIPNVVCAFTECRRVLRCGGRLVVFDYQKHVCRRLQKADPDHCHVWDFPDMKRRLMAAGFEPAKVWDITNGTSPRLGYRARQIFWLLTRVLGYKRQWLIVEAQK